MEKRFWVYIVTDKPYGTLYVGVTNDLSRRVYEHKHSVCKGFTKKYGLKLLVYAEEYPTALEAIQRKNCIKKWNREWKINNLIHTHNREWKDLGEQIN